jgi:hypothetical protein
MARYVTPAVAAARLSRYAGLAVPSSEGEAPTPMDDLISDASSLLEAFIGYAWESKNFTERIPIGRDGQGRLIEPDGLFVPVSAVTAVSIPPGAQYFGPSVDLSSLQWLADGTITLAYPVVYSPQSWFNPVPLGRGSGFNASLKLYPDELQVSYTAGKEDAPPEAFSRACVRLMVILLSLQDDPDALMATRQKVEGLGVDTSYRDDPLADALRPLARWKR